MYAQRTSQGQSAELVVGLINNMPPAARRATEQQFAELLKTASRRLRVRVKLFAVETLLDDPDDTLAMLDQSGADAVIVTGAEPRASAITDEPLWPALGRLIDWAGERTISTIWSCMAAHAAVFRLDQISRRPLARKLSGVFTCVKASDHPLLADAPGCWPVPHSRQNTLDETELLGSGYTVLSQARSIGVDCFVKQARASLFVLLQGHPEYGPDSLLNEFRRDVRRFVLGQRACWPDVPEGYFDAEVVAELAGLRARLAPGAEVQASVDAAITVAPRQVWRPAAVGLYAGWLSYLSEQKAACGNAAIRPIRNWRIAS
ncbi:homoserine O-acetyltransferase/O-succinyltransferase family protein [Rhodopila sp.]|uniref:homoserine O-acetyltransferase/O-succinyltransferase family protein n=1 Tax=Rhodopila sp. TaxID=2480087 RepID=UPI003D0A8CD1